MEKESVQFYTKNLARIALEIGAIQLNPENPFTWASGYRMPIYNDNRRLLGNAEHRLLVGRGMQTLLDQENISVDVIAGTATAGIPPATTLANILNRPLIYVRPQPKDHGMQNQIEGILKNRQNTVVVEDLVSTGGSALKAVEAIRQTGGTVTHCLCIFNYGFPEAAKAFEKANCHLLSLLTFLTLLQFAQQGKNITPQQVDLLKDWYANPFEWGKNQFQ
ncbi:MAG: orotate phosphoribosyltransferase [Nitrospinota bacterium]|nr:orotate phosphoribosyltransferase [Nitrospinota bacterium]